MFLFIINNSTTSTTYRIKGTLHYIFHYYLFFIYAYYIYINIYAVCIPLTSHTYFSELSVHNLCDRCTSSKEKEKTRCNSQRTKKRPDKQMSKGREWFSRFFSNVHF